MIFASTALPAPTISSRLASIFFASSSAPSASAPCRANVVAFCATYSPALLHPPISLNCWTSSLIFASTALIFASTYFPAPTISSRLFSISCASSSSPRASAPCRANVVAFCATYSPALLHPPISLNCCTSSLIFASTSLIFASTYFPAPTISLRLASIFFASSSAPSASAPCRANVVAFCATYSPALLHPPISLNCCTSSLIFASTYFPAPTISLRLASISCASLSSPRASAPCRANVVAFCATYSPALLHPPISLNCWTSSFNFALTFL